MYKLGFFVSGKPTNGGAYQYTLTMLAAFSRLNADKYQVVIFYKDNEWEKVIDGFGLDKFHVCIKDNFFTVKIEHMFWRFHKEWIAKVLYFLKNRKASKQIGSFSCDLLYTNTFSAMPHDACIMIPIHDLMHRYEPNIKEVSEEYEGRESMYKHICRNAMSILVDSELGKKHVIESYSKERKDLAEYVYTLPFIPPQYIYEAKEEEFNLPFEKFVFYPAQFWTHKNHIRLIEAIYQLKERGIVVNIVLVGSEQNNMVNVIDLIERYDLKNQVSIMGYVSNEKMVYLYRKARAMVMPTLMGPTNIPPLEAFYLGCPVATSNVYAISEQLSGAALLFDPYSVDDIANAIELLWIDDRLCKDLINRGIAHAEKWGPIQYSKRLENIIDETINKRKNG